MLFSTTTFLFVFLPCVLAIYLITPRKLKNIVLLLASLFFYAWGEPKFLYVMLLSIALNYVFGILADKAKREGKHGKLVITLMVIGNLIILGIFKYANFVVFNMESLFGANFDWKMIALPLGISFYTFQGISYVIDVYRGDGKVQKNPLNIALYISLFPQLVAGPIVRYQTVADQIESRRVDLNLFTSGVKRFIIGLAKKMFIANNCGLVADQIFQSQGGSLSVGTAWIGLIFYSLQIFFDFSGYSDMAIGLGRMFGFKFLENFNYPYIAKSVSEFWRRWHISLGTWFKDYVYIPLGGNRVSPIKVYRNLAIVWLATGIWHGASWNFLLWGAYYGAFIMLEKAFLGKALLRVPAALQHVYALIVIVFGWLLFRIDNVSDIWTYLCSMFGSGAFWDARATYYMHEYYMVLIVAIIACTPLVKNFFASDKLLTFMQKHRVLHITKDIATLAVLAFIFVYSVALVVGSTFNPFIYFRF
ncbi:MBOAT family O-acyltransferase [Listeria booriae]|uniref:MBOAT family O-acyltransferase n=1 Tax=Listeria booriae TaxID=1552123 RepID=UPI0016265FF1|nr:MBOAT family protein [Listeria booriae]MBC2366089.1 MBOAT family protein [Listeria booriae]